MKPHPGFRLLLGVFIASLWSPSLRADPEFFSYYRGTKRALEIDDTQVMVRLAAPGNPSRRPSEGQAKSFAQRAASLGYQPDEAAAHLPGGWIKLSTKSALASAQLPAAATPRDKIHRLLRDLAAIPDADFVCPVFKDTVGHPVNFESTILLGFKDGTSEADQNAILTRIRNTKAISRHGPRNKWTIELNARNGIDVLDAANELAVMPGVRYAEPNFVFLAQVL